MIGPISAYLFSNEKIPDFRELLLARLFLTSRPKTHRLRLFDYGIAKKATYYRGHW
jgi:hypothetical protein